MHIGVIGASGKVGRTALQNLYLKNHQEGVRLTLVSPWPQIDTGLLQDIENAVTHKLQYEPASFAPIRGEATDDYAALEGADLIVFTASEWPTIEEWKKFDEIDNSGRLVQSYVNYDIILHACRKIAVYAPKALIMMVTNQADVMTEVARQYLPKEQVLGFGGIVDSPRLRMHICQHKFGADEKALPDAYSKEKAYMIGYHNNDMIALSSSVVTPGLSTEELLEVEAKARRQGGAIAIMQRDPRSDNTSTGPSIMPGYALFHAMAAYIGLRDPIEEPFNINLDADMATRYGVPEGAPVSVPIRLGKGAYEPIRKYTANDREQRHLRYALKRMETDYINLLRAMKGTS